MNSKDPAEKYLKLNVAGREGVRFKRTTKNMRATVADSQHAWCKERLCDSLRGLGLGEDELLDRLDEFDANGPDDRQAFEFLISRRGRLEILRLALGDEPDGEAILEAMSEDEEFDALVGLGWLVAKNPTPPAPTPTPSEPGLKMAA